MTKKQKLFIVRPSMSYGGADRVTLTLLENLPQDEYDISLVLMRAEGAFFEDIPKHVKLINTNSKNLWLYTFPLLKILKKEKPDIVFSTCGGANMPLSLASFLIPKKKFKLILSERNILFPPGKSKLKRSLMMLAKKLFYVVADHHTAVSKGVKEEMIKTFALSPEQISVVDNPVITPQLLAQAKEEVKHPWFSEERSVPVILHAGRFVYQKDHLTLIKAFKLLTERKEARLFLLGEGPLEEEIKSFVKRNDLLDKVEFAGFDKNPFKYMSKCDLFVLSSHHEGMPGVLVQAMACGAPSISTDCPTGPNEIIKKEFNNGRLVPVGDAVAMASAMEEILTEPLQNIEKGVERFKLEVALSSYLKVIQEA
jgi:glycosyltransferase involved in cell wall biosynthesis